MPAPRRLSDALRMLPGLALTSSSPKFFVKAICCSSVMFWSRKHEHAVAVHAVLDRHCFLAAERLGQVDARHFAREHRVDLLDDDGHEAVPFPKAHSCYNM